MKKTLFTIFIGLLTVICIFGSACGVYNKGGYYDYQYIEGGIMPSKIVGDNYVYGRVIEQAETATTESNVSTVSLDCNTSSYTLMKSQIKEGMTVGEDSVRLEEYVNYFDYNYPYPEEDEFLTVNTYMTYCPWNDGKQLLTVGVRTKKIETTGVLNNIVLLLDVSGSMYGANRLDLIKEGFSMLIDQLTENDRVSIVTYASGTKVVCSGEVCSDNNKSKIKDCLFGLQAYGSTNGEGGLKLAYDCAKENFIKDGNNRIFLATDGDFNVGVSSEGGIAAVVSEYAESGVYMSVYGVGMYNTNDKTMQAIAKNANGNAYYISDLNDAKKAFVKDLFGAMYTTCKDAKFKATFNTETVDKFRILGYDTKIISVEDYEDDDKDTGEIGSGLTVTICYEVTLKQGAKGEIVTAEVNYENTQKGNLRERVSAVYDNSVERIAVVNEDIEFIGCVLEYGLILRNSEYKGYANFMNIIMRLDELNCTKNDEYKKEFLDIVKSASKIYARETY